MNPIYLKTITPYNSALRPNPTEAIIVRPEICSGGSQMGDNELQILWILAHVGIPENKETDQPFKGAITKHTTRQYEEVTSYRLLRCVEI